MSYARFGYDDSSVYVFLSCDGLLECCACSLGGCVVPTTWQMIEHLALHQAHGDTVPEGCIRNLTTDSRENDAWMALPASTRAYQDRQRENREAAERRAAR